MINFFCSLWGDKYSIDYVDKLYSMVEKNCKEPFTFYCQTDKKGFRQEVNTLPFLTDLPKSTPEEMWNSDGWFMNGLPRLWDRPKLNYWKPNGWGITGTKVALDIDIIIQNDMSPIFDIWRSQDKAMTGRSWWHNMDHESLPQWRRRYGARNNGGFYMWEDWQVKDIWNDLQKNAKFIYFCFHGGSDNFISTRHLDKFQFLPKQMWYSFNRGSSWPDDIQMYKHRPEKIICVFNTDIDHPHHLELDKAAKDFPWVNKYWQ